MTTRNHYNFGGQRIAERVSGDGLYYILTDHLGSTSMMVKSGAETGALELRYKAFGETRYSGGTTTDPYRYTGQLSKMATVGLYFYQSRWMDPVTGHFAQPDSIVPDPYQPQSWDRYSYVNNNPVMYNDPSGHCLVLCTALIGAAVGAAIAGTTYALTNQGESFEWGEFAVAAGGGAVAGALVGSGIGLVAGAVSAATAAGVTVVATSEAVTAASATSASLISAGVSAGASELSYMAQTPGNFEVSPYVIGSAVSGAVGYYSPGASFGAKVGLNVAGAELTYAATAKKPTAEGALASGLGGAASGAVDWGMDALVAPTLDTFIRFTPGPVAHVTGATADGIFSNAWGNVASIYAQKKALEEK